MARIKPYGSHLVLTGQVTASATVTAGETLEVSNPGTTGTVDQAVTNAEFHGVSLETVTAGSSGTKIVNYVPVVGYQLFEITNGGTGDLTYANVSAMFDLKSGSATQIDNAASTNDDFVALEVDITNDKAVGFFRVIDVPQAVA